MTGAWGVGDRLRAALATFKSFSIRTDPTGGLSLGLDIDARPGRADSEGPGDRIRRVGPDDQSSYDQAITRFPV